jgi:aspartate kinase
MEEIVCKFGGSSLASAEQIRKVWHIIESDPNRRYVVVSAPGKANPGETKVTDLLINLASAVTNHFEGQHYIDLVAQKFGQIARDLGLEKDYEVLVRQDLNDRIEKYKNNSQALMNALKAAGEDNNAKLVADFFKKQGLPAIYVSPAEAGFYLENHKGVVRCLPESYDNLREYLLERHELVVFPGFFGYDKEGNILTFTRGGSDVTGSILAASVQADRYENFTDVDCVYAVKPDLVPNPHPIKEMTYDEMRELAYTGFNILHEDALEPVRRHNIPLHILNTNNPEGMGTIIVNKRTDFDGILTGISGKKGFCVLHVEKYLMNQEVGFAMDVLKIIADYNVPFEHMPSGIDSLSIIFREEVLTPDKERLIVNRILKELEVDACYVTHELAIIMAVGVAMKNAVGVLGRAVSALSAAGINIELVVQGPSEISILFGIKSTLCNYAIRELYKAFFNR